MLLPLCLMLLLSPSCLHIYYTDPDPVVPDPVHECARTCEWPAKPRKCSYVFTVEWFQTMSSACYDCPSNMADCERPGCIPLDGVSRPVVTVNRQLPGPAIEVRVDWCYHGY